MGGDDRFLLLLLLLLPLAGQRRFLHPCDCYRQIQPFELKKTVFAVCIGSVQSLAAKYCFKTGKEKFRECIMTLAQKTRRGIKK
ncbi:hypothetical protein IWX49DRAFT_73660 [Phyllosticta citricarpa]